MIAHYTQNHMDNFKEVGYSVEHYQATNESAARSRLQNAALRLGVKIRTEIDRREHIIVGRVVQPCGCGGKS